MKSVTIDGVEYRAVLPGSRRVVSVAHGFTWIGEYNAEVQGTLVWVRLRRARIVQKYRALGIDSLMDSPESEDLIFGSEVAEDLLIPFHAVLWTSEVTE